MSGNYYGRCGRGAIRNMVHHIPAYTYHSLHFLQGGQWWYRTTQETAQPMRLANNYSRARGVGEFRGIAAGCEVVAGTEQLHSPHRLLGVYFLHRAGYRQV